MLQNIYIFMYVCIIIIIITFYSTENPEQKCITVSIKKNIKNNCFQGWFYKYKFI